MNTQEQLQQAFEGLREGSFLKQGARACSSGNYFLGVPPQKILICHDFATPRLALIRFIQRNRDFSSRDVNFYAAKNDYALYVAVGPRIDTVGVWGSNCDAPTILIRKSHRAMSEAGSFSRALV